MRQHQHVIHDRLDIVVRKQRERRHRRPFGVVANRPHQVRTARFRPVRRGSEFEDAAAVITRARVHEFTGRAGAVPRCTVTMGTTLLINGRPMLQVVARRRVGPQQLWMCRRTTILQQLFADRRLQVLGQRRRVGAGDVCQLGRATASRKRQREQ